MRIESIQTYLFKDLDHKYRHIAKGSFTGQLSVATVIFCNDNNSTSTKIHIFSENSL